MNINRPENKKMDLVSDQFPHDLEWEQAKRLQSLQRLFVFADTHCTKAIQWYNVSKRSKQALGYNLRFLSIISVAVAGIIPVMSEIICKESVVRCISPAWATIFLALAALFVALDRFAGYTSGWVRYVKSAQKLTELQGQFRLDWCMYLHSETNDSADQPKEAGSNQDTAYPNRDYGLYLCKEYINSINLVISKETDLWAQEFQQTLIQFEKPASQDLMPLNLNQSTLEKSANDS